MEKDEEIRMIHEKLDYYMMETNDDQFEAEKVVRLLKRLEELEPQTNEKLDAEKAVRDFWKYVEEREREERIIFVEGHKMGNL